VARQARRRRIERARGTRRELIVMRTTIVVPCYNEAERLDLDRFAAYTEFDPDTAFLFADDGSTDRTGGLLRAACAERPDRWSVLSLDRNRGKAEAVRRGMAAAAASGAEAVGYWDADLATPLDAIPDFVRVLETRPDIGVVIGARVQLLGRRIERHPARHYLGRIFATAVSLTLGLRVYDTQCGAKLFRTGPILDRVLAEPFTSRWIFDVEILARLVRAHRAGCAPAVEAYVCELPLLAWCDVHGSKLGPSDFFRAVPELAAIRQRYLRRAAAAGAVTGAIESAAAAAVAEARV
jgi:dolichyl-phosphate beta-glucosyltransferase